MLRIRFIRTGKKNRPNFRLVVAPQRSAPQTGRFLEVLGHYDPIKHEGAFKKERIQHWLSRGANPSDRALNTLISEGIMEGKKVAAHSRKPSKKAKESAQSPEGNEAGSPQSSGAGLGEEAPADKEEPKAKEESAEEENKQQ